MRSIGMPLKNIILTCILFVAFAACDENRLKFKIYPLERDKHLALNRDVYAANRVVDYYIDNGGNDRVKQLEYWSRIAANDGSSSGARMYAIQMLTQEGNCAEAIKWLDISNKIAIQKRESKFIIENNADWVKYTNAECHKLGRPSPK